MGLSGSRTGRAHRTGAGRRDAAAGLRVRLERPTPRREREFLARERASRRLHRPWVAAPATAEAYREFMARSRGAANRSFLVVAGAGREIAGAVIISEIVLGPFRSAYLGYYAFAPFAGRGLMSAGIRLALDLAFSEIGLHRIEANVQPGNGKSIRLLRRLGFRKEGFSPKYLKILGRWRDHERWAVLAEEWRRLRPATGRTRSHPG